MIQAQDLYYEDKTNTLTVTYSNGIQWMYHPINPETYTEILAADCLHRTLHSTIRNLGVVGVRRGH